MGVLLVVLAALVNTGPGLAPGFPTMVALRSSALVLEEPGPLALPVPLTIPPTVLLATRRTTCLAPAASLAAAADVMAPLATLAALVLPDQAF